MASPDILDFIALLAPIREDSPTGSDLRQDSSPLSKYQSIKSARAAARAAERKSMHDGDTAEADEYWRKILILGPDILATQSKDLEVASWLTEALIRRHGFQGLRDAFKLIQGLLENYWDGLYPTPDEDGIETRTAPLSGLNGEGAEGVLIAPIRKVPLTDPDNQVSFSLWQYQQALETLRGPDEATRASKVQKLGFSLEDIEKAVENSSSEFFVDQLDDVTAAINLYKNIDEQLHQRCHPEPAPTTRNIISILEECRGAICHIGKEKFPVEVAEVAIPEQTETEQGSMTNVANVAAAANNVPGKINNRAAALRQMQEIANFFRDTEPHSPISYIIEKAIKWGSMSLDELIVELIPEPSSRAHFSQLTGVISENNED